MSDLGIAEIDTDSEIGKVSIIGAGMRSHPGVAAQVFETLATRDINIEMISTSPIKISCVIRSEAVPEAVQALHEVFQLSLSEVQRERPIGQEAR
jgi:aspartate kinase